MLNGKQVLAIIPARAGSVGVPGKNYREIYGKPLIWWSIEAAEQSRYVDITAISSNCEKCLSIARMHRGQSHEITGSCNPNDIYRLYNIRRPDRLCCSSSKTEDAMYHAVDFLRDTYQKEFGYIVLLQPTSPCRTNNLIDCCLNKMITEDADSVLTVSRHTPFFWQIKEDKKPHPNYSNLDRPMRQNIPENDFYFHDNGNMYAVEENLLKSCGRYGRNPVMYETDVFQSMQIDTQEDFLVMEKMAEIRQGFLTCNKQK